MSLPRIDVLKICSKKELLPALAGLYEHSRRVGDPAWSLRLFAGLAQLKPGRVTAIVEHQLAPGTKLTEQTLTEIYGVSRAAQHSPDEHEAMLDALQAGDIKRAGQPKEAHLRATDGTMLFAPRAAAPGRCDGHAVVRPRLCASGWSFPACRRACQR